MSTPTHHHDADAAPSAGHDTGSEEHGSHGGHSMWMMVLCCIPMVIPIVLIIFGR